jgi:uncharacterized protein (DUF2236 family)
MLWQYAGDSRIAFMGTTIGLLQLMHPGIGAGVMQHSNFFEDPADRILRSLPRILGVVYDEDGEATGRAVRDEHRPITGTDAVGRRYHALDPSTYWWAHATFQFMAEQVADRFDRRRLSPNRREQLYQEGVEWYRRYGVSDRVVPETRAAFQEEWDRVCSEVLEMNEAVEFVLDIATAPRIRPWDDASGMPAPVRTVANTGLARRLTASQLRLLAIGGLPEIVRSRFGIPFSLTDRVRLASIEQTVALAWPALPAKARWQPRAHDGWVRATGAAP